jgi:hypothetical protein
MHIQAISSSGPDFSIAAALDRPEVRAVSRLLASAGIEKPTAKIPRHEFEAKLRASSLTPEQRIEAKIALERAGLIA